MAAEYVGPDSELVPDAASIRRFFGWWFETCSEGMVEIGWLGRRDKSLNNFRQFRIGDWDELVAVAFQENMIPGQSMYYRAATVRESNSGNTADNDFVSAPGPWGDIDTEEQMAAAKSVQTIVRPNGSVITGRVPHMRAQSFFRCDGPISNPALLRSLNRRVHKLYGGDSSVVNPTRLMRMPGTIAWPWKEHRVPELTTFAIAVDRNQSYSVSVIGSQLPQEDDGKAGTGPSGRATLNSVAEHVRQIREGEGWRDHMLRLTAHWIGRGWSNTEIMLAVESLPKKEWRDKIDMDDVSKAIKTGRDRWGVQDQEHIISGSPESPFPENVIDPWDTLQPPEFPIHSLPGILRAYVESRARVMGADPCAIAWSALSAFSAAVDGRTRLRLKKHDTWAVPAPLWVALIGRSSAKKTPIISDTWRPLEALQNVALRAYADQMARWNSLPKDEKKDTPQPPKPTRLLSHDATMEGLQDLLSHQDRGIGILRDELAGFIGAMDKYSGSGNGGAADRAFWLQSYNGGAHVVDRVGRGTVAINNLLATICGGIQPERLAQFSNLADDGLWQRFVPIIMKPGTMGTDEPPGDAVDAYSARLQGLVDTSCAPGAALSDAAHEIRADFEKDIFELEQAEPLGSRFAAFTGKLPGLFGRLALVLSYMEPSGLGFVVGEKPAQQARSLIKNCVIPHAARVYMTMEAHAAGSDGMQGIAGYLLTKKLPRVVMSDLTSNVRQCRKLPVHDVMRMVSPLVSGGWLLPESETGNNRAWLVNPLVHVQFANRAAVEKTRRAAARELIAQEAE